jgi:two-component system, NarL family, invasion response regulator UvrY
MTTILLIDDHAVVRAGVRRLIASRTGVTLLETAKVDEALKILRTATPSLIMLDLNLPGLGGLEALRHLRSKTTDIPILVFSMHSEPIYAVRATEAGAQGFVSKSASPDELLLAIETVLSGQKYVEKEIAREIGERATESGNYLRSLTARDLEILRLLVEGKTIAEIAGALGVAYKTIANTLTRMREKLGARNAAELISVSRGLGLA